MFCKECQRTFAGACWSCTVDTSKAAIKAAARRTKRRERREREEEERRALDAVLDAAVEKAQQEAAVRETALALAQGRQPCGKLDTAFVHVFTRFLDADDDAFLWCAGYLFVKTPDGVTGYPMSEEEVLRFRKTMESAGGLDHGLSTCRTGT